MENNNSHIISRFKWDTSFNKKEQAFELQERLSAWSNTVMQREITTVFDKICPPGQVWKIDAMEIDLGKITFENLESELSNKLHQGLNAAFINMVIGNNKGSQKIEITDTAVTTFDMLSYFLLHGLLPWNYKPVYGSVNQMMGNQLQHNQQKIIEIIKKLGAVKADTHKRIAWQFNERIIIEIIKKIEPNNHNTIIYFSNELIKVQQKKVIGGSGTGEFKNNLLSWILYYLLTGRGTFFNKIAFLKCGLQQWASHYNIVFEDLLNIIEQVAIQTNASFNESDEFIFILKEVIKQSKNPQKILNARAEMETDPFIRLIGYFNDQSFEKAGFKKEEFNELFVTLAGQNEQQFSDMVSTVEQSANGWMTIVDNLNDASLEILVKSLIPGKSNMLIDTIYFIDQLSRELNLDIIRHDLWKIGIGFLQKHTNASFNNTIFLEYCITAISKNNQILKIRLLNQMVNVQVSSSIKSIATLSIYNNLTAIFVSAITQKGPDFFEGKFIEILEMLSRHGNERSIDNSLFITLQKTLIKSIQFNPAAALKAFILYPNKDQLKKITPYILNDFLIGLLMKNPKREIAAALSLVQIVLSELKINKQNDPIIELVESNILSIGLHSIIFYRNLNYAQVLDIILKEISLIVEGTHQKYFKLFIQKILFNNKPVHFSLSKDVANTLLEKYNKNETGFSLKALKQLIADSDDNRIAIEKMLISNFLNKAFIQLRVSKKEAGIVLNYLLNGGDKLMETLIKEYTIFFKDHLQQLSTKEIFLLQELYWQCILNYVHHKGDKKLVRNSFQIAVQYHFAIPNSVKKALYLKLPIIDADNNLYQLENGSKISYNKIFFLLENMLVATKGELTHNETIYHLDELTKVAIELDTKEYLRIFRRLSFNEMHIGFMNAFVSFDWFCFWIGNEIEGAPKEKLELIRQLYDVIGRISSTQITGDLLLEYWKYSIKIISSNNWSMVDFDQLVQKSFQYITTKTPVDIQPIALDISTAWQNIDPILKTILIGRIPAFATLLSNKKILPINKKLESFAQKGLVDILTFYIVTEQGLPAWYGQSNKEDVKSLLNAIVISYPIKLLLTLKQAIAGEQQMIWLSQSIDFDALIVSIGSLNKNRESLLFIIANFYTALENIPIKGMRPKDLQSLLFKKILKAWTTNNWKLISIDHIWNELIWDSCVKKNILRKDFIQGIEKAKSQLPLSLQISFGYLKEQSNLNVIEKTKSKTIKAMNDYQQNQILSPGINGSILIKNAGLVLLNSYIPMLFDRLAVVKNNHFLNTTTQLNAVHYLQYVVTGLSNTEEPFLVINKILCGLAVQEPVQDGIVITDAQQQLIDGLINAVIAHWPAVGSSSISGFRGNWLVRDGLLTEQEDKWELTVEKRAYDILINKCPFSFSIIKYPWMNKPLHVNWNY